MTGDSSHASTGTASDTRSRGSSRSGRIMSTIANTAMPPPHHDALVGLTNIREVRPAFAR
uniref:Unannotated protein n=1 Tax=freshwater metagenome TaxID=449393 RepID=A0A6J7Q642_9ZZZZ